MGSSGAAFGGLGGKRSCTRSSSSSPQLRGLTSTARTSLCAAMLLSRQSTMAPSFAAFAKAGRVGRAHMQSTRPRAHAAQLAAASAWSSSKSPCPGLTVDTTMHARLQCLDVPGPRAGKRPHHFQHADARARACSMHAARARAATLTASERSAAPQPLLQPPPAAHRPLPQCLMSAEGLLSGLLFVTSTAASMRSIQLVGLAAAVAVGSGTAALVSFVLGEALEPGSIASMPTAAAGIGGLVAGLALVAWAGAAQLRRRPSVLQLRRRRVVAAAGAPRRC